MSSSLKRKAKRSLTPIKIEFKSRRHCHQSDDDLIRLRLLYEGDQGSDDRRILTLTKLFTKSPFEIDKLLSILYSIEHSYRLSKSTVQMDQREQICYTKKSQSIHEQILQIHHKLHQREQRLIEVKRRQFNLLEYNRCIDRINNLGTRKELRTQQLTTLERKHYFQHLQQTFEATYQQRLKQIAVYMRPIFEFDDILQQDIHEDGEQPTTPSTKTNIDRSRTYSDSSLASIDGDDNISTRKPHIRIISSSTNNEPRPLFSNDIELYGTQLVRIT